MTRVSIKLNQQFLLTFLAPKGALKMQMSVCVCVCLSVHLSHNALNPPKNPQGPPIRPSFEFLARPETEPE